MQSIKQIILQQILEDAYAKQWEREWLSPKKQPPKGIENSKPEEGRKSA